MAWIDSLFQRETLPVLEASMGFAHAKQLTIMNNIANVETPYYKRQSVPEDEFQFTLSRAIRERADKHPAEFEIRGDQHIQFSGTYPHMQVTKGMEFGPERHDENSVVIEKEMVDLAKNSLMMSAMQQLMRKKLTMLRSSLRDRVA